VAGITAAQATPFVNLLNSRPARPFRHRPERRRRGYGQSGLRHLSLGEKWEALSIVAVLDAAALNDYFLLVGNDNDFLGTQRHDARGSCHRRHGWHQRRR
jgi:hypothetical protein